MLSIIATIIITWIGTGRMIKEVSDIVSKNIGEAINAVSKNIGDAVERVTKAIHEGIKHSQEKLESKVGEK